MLEEVSTYYLLLTTYYLLLTTLKGELLEQVSTFENRVQKEDAEAVEEKVGKAPLLHKAQPTSSFSSGSTELFS